MLKAAMLRIDGPRCALRMDARSLMMIVTWTSYEDRKCRSLAAIPLLALYMRTKTPEGVTNFDNLDTRQEGVPGPIVPRSYILSRRSESSRPMPPEADPNS